MVGRQRHQRRQVDVAQELGQAALAGAAAFLAGQQAGGVAGVEQDHAALRQIGLDALDGTGGEVGMVGRDRPVEQREQSEVVGGDVDRPGIGGLDRGAHREHAGQALEAGLALAVDVGPAGHDIGQPGLAGQVEDALVGGLVLGQAGHGQSRSRTAAVAGAASRRGGQQAAQGQGDREVEQRQKQGRQDQRRREIALGRARVGLRRAAGGAAAQGHELGQCPLQVERRAGGLAVGAVGALADRGVEPRRMARAGHGGGEGVGRGRGPGPLRLDQPAEAVEQLAGLERARARPRRRPAPGPARAPSSPRTGRTGAGWSRRYWRWCGPGSASPCRGGRR